MRTTKTQLRETVARLNRKGAKITISWAYGRPRVYDHSESRELSPRLPTGEMSQWLDGFEAGYDMFG